MKKIILLIFIYCISLTAIWADEYNTNDSGEWQDDVWDETTEMPLEFAQNENNLVFNIHEGHTIELPEGDTIIFNGNNLEFNVYGEFIVKGHIELAGNNTTLVINGFLTVDGSINFDGNNGEIEGDGVIDGDGDITGDYEKSDDINNALPVSLLYFKGNIYNNKILFEWATATETNNNYFIIKRSKNLNQWTNIDTIKGAGDSNIKIKYQYKDKNPIQGLLYYKLKQVDYDGKYEYFKPIIIFFENGVNNQLYIKHIFIDKQTLNLQILNKTGFCANLAIIDLQGNLLNYQKIISFSNIQYITIDLNGDYFNTVIVINLFNVVSLEQKKLIIN